MGAGARGRDDSSCDASGFKKTLDDSVESRFEEMRYLESGIGKTGMLAIEPFLEVSQRDLWHLNVLEDSHS